jgi:hypothetical protein
MGPKLSRNLGFGTTTLQSGYGVLTVERDKNVTRQHGNGLNESLYRGCGIENAKYIPPHFVYGVLIFIFYSKELLSQSVVYS